MKKIISIILSLLLIFSVFAVYAAEDISLTLNGIVLKTDVAPIIVNSRTMVPFRAIFEALNIEVNWSDALKKVYATTLDGTTIILTVGSDKMVLNTDVIDLDAAPFIENSRVLVPVRAVCEALKCSVDWRDDTRTVVIKTLDYQDKVYSEIIGDGAYYKKDTDFKAELFSLINAKRQEAGLSALNIDEALSQLALSHSADMAAKDYFDHTSPDGVGPFDRIDNAGVSYVAAAENIASGFATSQKVIDSWMASAKHRDNILNGEFTKVGIGYWAGGSNGTYWTVVFISD